MREANASKSGANAPKSSREGNGRDKAREARAKKIDESNDQNVFLMNCHMAITTAVYTGPVDETIVDTCRKVIRVWTQLLRKIEEGGHGHSAQDEEQENLSSV